MISSERPGALLYIVSAVIARELSVIIDFLHCRNRRMFGALLGTLKRFQNEEKSTYGSKVRHFAIKVEHY